MTSTTRFNGTFSLALAAVTGVAMLSAAVGAQDRLKTMPGYEQYLRMSKELPAAVKMGTLPVSWKDGGNALSSMGTVPVAEIMARLLPRGRT